MSAEPRETTVGPTGLIEADLVDLVDAAVLLVLLVETAESQPCGDQSRAATTNVRLNGKTVPYGAAG